VVALKRQKSEIGHEAMKELFNTNPDLVESPSHIIAERRLGPADRPEDPAERRIRRSLASIRRFFRLK
jgi:hypothetical protein